MTNVNVTFQGTWLTDPANPSTSLLLYRTECVGGGEPMSIAYGQQGSVSTNNSGSAGSPIQASGWISGFAPDVAIAVAAQTKSRQGSGLR